MSTSTAAGQVWLASPATVVASAIAAELRSFAELMLGTEGKFCCDTVIAFARQTDIIRGVICTQRKTLQKIFADPVSGNIEWARIESLLKAAGCRIFEGAGSAVTFEFNGRRMTLHRPHPGKEALRYRVLAVREFIEKTGINS